MKLYALILLLFINFSVASNTFDDLDINTLEPDDVEAAVMLSYSIKDEQQLSSMLNLVNRYLLANPSNSRIQNLYQQRVQHFITAQELTGCVSPEAQGFADRVLDDSIAVAPCSKCEGLYPLQNSFTEFAQQFVSHQQETSEDLIQQKFLELGVISAAENLAQLEYLSNPNATAQSIFDQICSEQNRNPVVNLLTSQKHITQCSPEMAPAVRAAIEKKISNLAGQERFSIPHDNENILAQLKTIVDELNSALEPITATVRPVYDPTGKVVNHTMQTFGVQVALQLDDGAQEHYQHFLELFYQKTSQGIGSLLLSSKIISHLPSIDIDNRILSYKSDFVPSGTNNEWGDEVHTLSKLPYPDDISDLRDDIEKTILDGTEELKKLEDQNLSPKEIGKYVAINPMNLAKVLANYPELNGQACLYINYAQEFTSRREATNEKLRAASRWLGVGGAALSIIAGPLGAVPACIIGASTGTLATATNGAVLIREYNHLQDLQTAYATGGGDTYSIEEIIDSYDQLNEQTLEFLVELAFTIVDYIQLAKAIKITRATNLTQSIEEFTDTAEYLQIKNKDELMDFTSDAPRYQPRIRQRAVEDPKAHNFPYSFDEEILKVEPTIRNDGALVYRKAGTMNDKEGFFVISVNPDSNTIFHRVFTPTR